MTDTLNKTNAVALVDTYAQFPFTLAEGSGSKVRDSQGNEYWDLYGGHAVTLLGHAHPAVTRAVSEQAGRLTFYSNAVPIEIRTRAAERLCAFAPDGIEHVFFCNSGAEANENALKLAIQQSGRTRIAALAGGFHGRTLLALSATASDKLREPYRELLCPVERLRPNEAADVERIDDTIAAVIVEPILSMAGIVTLSGEFLQALRRRCDQVGALLVYDEVQTGMGRLGRPFAAGEHGVTPDMITLAKGIANGVPMGALLMSPAVADKVAIGDLGSTFGGGPLACAALLAVLETIEADGLLEQAAAFGRAARERLLVGPVREVIGCGCLIGLRMDGDVKPVQQRLLGRGFITGTSGDPHVLRLLPPINTPSEAIEELKNALEEMV
ncbi:MAG: aminotransferase class III-fold pyridoxal phosphate-dependent enzyme [Planctomycetes bacterium]|nr:aminotransferase class III-fold pyridoxal phosphate-dependent enzyme [Planctomycetota bacterium]